jgi:hypothetical protein
MNNYMGSNNNDRPGTGNIIISNNVAGQANNNGELLE